MRPIRKPNPSPFSKTNIRKLGDQDERKMTEKIAIVLNVAVALSPNLLAKFTPCGKPS